MVGLGMAGSCTVEETKPQPQTPSGTERWEKHPDFAPFPSSKHPSPIGQTLPEAAHRGHWESEPVRTGLLEKSQEWAYRQGRPRSVGREPPPETALLLWPS